MTILHQPGDGIEGELIVFQCRNLKVRKRPIQATSAHRAKAGKLEDAQCFINRRFRWIPENREST